MKKQSRTLLAALKEAAWFCAVGKPVKESALVLSSWKEAVKRCKSRDWQAFCVEIGNRLRERIYAISPARLDDWNGLVSKLRPVADAVVEQKAGDTHKQVQLPIIFLHSAQADLLMALLEQEFSDIVPLDAGTLVAKWYLKGHFPCGWDGGEYPKGRIIVY